VHWLRNNANTEHHPAGTCRMGTDAMAVTDGEGCVHGIENLRIVDGSLMPRVPTANIQAPIMMVAEKIAAAMTRKISQQHQEVLGVTSLKTPSAYL
jgi:choline dehydrogenase